VEREIFSPVRSLSGEPVTKIELWDIIKNGLKTQLSKSDYESWVKPLRLYNSEGNKLIIDVPSPFYKEWFVEHCLKAAYRIAEVVGFKDVEFEFASLALDGAEQLKLPLGGLEDKADNLRPTKFNPAFTFKQFVVGPSNQMAYAAARAVSESPGSSYNPLFIYGQTGLGKTHLLSAIGSHFMQKTKAAKVIYTTTESFMMEMIQAIMANAISGFRNRYRTGCDVLLMDDIHILAGNKERTREEFFYTFNCLLESQRQIVLSSDRPPREIEAEDRLVSRFLGGLIVDIRPPEFETRIAILKRKAKALGHELSEDVAQYLAEIFVSNVRELEGALNSLVMRSLLRGKPIDRELAQDVIRSTGKSTSTIVDIERIIKAVSAYFNLTPQDLKSQKRSRAIALSRHVAMYIARTESKMSFPEIGKRFGGKDHTSVIHAVNKIAREIESDTDLKKVVEDLKVAVKK